MARAQDLIGTAYRRFTTEVPALGKLKLTLRIELRGRGDVQVFGVRVPGPEVTKGEPENPRLEVIVPRSDFNELAEKGRLPEWRAAYERGHLKVLGDPEVQKLIGTVIERSEARSHLKKAH